MVAVTAAGALVVLDPSSGAVVRSLVPGGVIGDETSVAPDGTVYFTRQSGCTDDIESVADTGGAVSVLGPGMLPAVSPDGTKLAYASEPMLTLGCTPETTDLTSLLYLAGQQLYVSQDGATARELTAGLIAAAWE